jgi:hypothetical protein
MLERKFNWDESIKIVTQELAECPDAEYVWSDAQGNRIWNHRVNSLVVVG